MDNFPILSRFQHDCHVKVVDTQASDTIAELAAACAHQSVGVHVKDQPGKILRVRPTTDDDNAEPYSPDMTVKDAGLVMYDCIDVYFTDPQS
jgi:toluene monooxygenase system protein B